MTSTTTVPPDLQGAAGRPRSPLAPLHPHGRVPRRGGADHRARRRLPRGREREALLDALAGLFSVNLGYGFGEEMDRLALEQMRERPSTRTGRPRTRAIELAREVTALAPGDLQPRLFVRGSEAVESALKLARQYFLARGGKRIDADDAARRACRRPHAAQVQGDRAPDRLPRDDGRVVDQRHPRPADAVRAARARGAAREEHELLPLGRFAGDRGRVHGDAARRIRVDVDPRDGAGDGPASSTWSRCRTRAAPSRRPRVLARRARALRPLRHPPLRRRGDHRLRPGRRWFASERYDIRPDIVCCAKGLSSSYAAIGAVLATDRG